MSDQLSRRGFVKKSAGAVALAAGPAILPALGANDKINIGVIGTGGRGYYLMERFYQGAASYGQIGSICDAYDGRLARGKDRVQTMGGNAPKTTKDYKEILADRDITAVIIATPEHLHYEMTMAALKAGKDIYLEKPLAYTIEQGAEIVRYAKQTGKVVQVGTQNRSNSLYIKAKEMIAEGVIGDVHYVRAFWYRNSLTDNPAWRYEIPADASPENTDFAAFLGGRAPKRAFDKQRFYQWRLYWDYSGGISTDLLVHQTDITNFVCGKTVPTSCMASGGIYRWKDGRDVPDTISAIYEYPGDFHINYSCYFGNEYFGYGEEFLGNEGTIEVKNRSILNFYPETFRGRAPKHVAARKPIKMEVPMNDNKAVEAHLVNWFDAIRGKAKLIAPPEVGQEAAIGGHMSTLSYRQGKKIIWNAQTQKYRFV
jgi:predicted dehydrogenase